MGYNADDGSCLRWDKACQGRLKDRAALNRRTFIPYSILRVLFLAILIRCIVTSVGGAATSVLDLSIVGDRTRIEIPTDVGKPHPGPWHRNDRDASRRCPPWVLCH